MYTLHRSLLEQTHDSKFEEFIDCLKGEEFVVLDNYFYTSEYQKQIKEKGCKLVCIDDMHDKHYYADVVINHGLIDKKLFDIESYTRLCLGLDYALLRKPFIQASSTVKNPNSWFISFGGTDYLNLTEKALQAIHDDPRVDSITVVIGDAYKYIENLKNYPKATIEKNLTAEEMADVMCKAQYAILPSSSVCIEALACRCKVAAGFFVHHLRVKGLLELLAHSLAHQQEAADLHAAAGAACAGTHKHQHDKDLLGEGGPQVKIAAGKSCGGNDRAHLEGGVAQGLAQAVVHAVNVGRDDDHSHTNDHKVGAHLLAGGSAAEAAHQQQEIGVEVHAKQDHKDGHDPLDIGRHAGKTVIAEAEAAGARCAKGGSSSRVFNNSFSCRISRLLVGSSITTTSGSASMTRAMPTRCRSPPERRLPMVPISVAYPSGNVRTNSCSPARFAAVMISSMDASGFPRAILSAMVPLKRKVSCSNTAILRCSSSSEIWSMGIPLIRMEPPDGFQNRSRRRSTVDLPIPLSPTIPTLSPSSILRLNPSRIFPLSCE